jgi:hypothetical protein
MLCVIFNLLMRKFGGKLRNFMVILSALQTLFIKDYQKSSIEKLITKILNNANYILLQESGDH